MAEVQDLGGQYGHRGAFTPCAGASNTLRRWKALSPQMRTAAHRATVGRRSAGEQACKPGSVRRDAWAASPARLSSL